MLKKNAYFRTVYRPYLPFYVSLITAGTANANYFAQAVGVPCSIHNLIKSDHVWYYVLKETQRCGKLAFRAWRHPQKLRKAQQLFVQWEKNLLTAARHDLASYAAAYAQYMPALILVWGSDQFVADAVRSALQKKVSPEKAEKLMHVLNIPLRNNFYKQEEYDLLKADDLAQHIQRYEWLHSRYGEIRPYTIAEARRRRATMDRAAFLQEWKEQKQEVRSAIRRVKKLLGSDASLVDLMQFIVYYRTQRTDMMHRSAYIFAPILKTIARSKGLTYEEALHCTKAELTGKTPSRKVLQGRMRDHAIVFENGRRLRVLTGKACDAIRHFVKEDVAAVKQFSGTIASRGNARGIARIIFANTDFPKVKKGDILVTSMTTPQMVPIMKKAAAFITDEGGITCHAAIISRELRKPCIIGTKVATRVLKDGDRIEVNATNGVIRKL